MGILLALTVVCAVLARCGAFGTGETLEELAKKQELAAAENPESAVSGDDLSAGEDTTQPETARPFRLKIRKRSRNLPPARRKIPCLIHREIQQINRNGKPAIPRRTL